MKRFRFLNIVVAGLSVVMAFSAIARAAEPTVSGLWEQLDDRGHGWFLFFERDGMYEGAIVRMYLKPNEPPFPICNACAGDQKNAPLMGLVIVKGMQRHGLAYENGKILDPRNGNVYDAKMKLSPDGQRLTVRGYLGIDLFGQDQIWKRLPDDALAPNDLPPSLLPHLGAAQGQQDNRLIQGTNIPRVALPKGPLTNH
jgi:hypothetical protein